MSYTYENWADLGQHYKEIHTPARVLESLFDTKEIDSYLQSKREALQNELKDLLRKKYVWTVTDEPVVIDNDFLYYNFNYEKSLSSFRYRLSSGAFTLSYLQNCIDFMKDYTQLNPVT